MNDPWEEEEAAMNNTWEKACRKIIDMMADDLLSSGGYYWDPDQDMEEDNWWDLGCSALQECQNLGYGSADIHALLVKKQHDYGHSNIMNPPHGTTPEQAVAVRLNDKIARIKNLTKRGVYPANESLLDSYMDIVGYCVILLMLREGTFTLPLEKDMEPQPDDKELSDAGFVFKIKILGADPGPEGGTVYELVPFNGDYEPVLASGQMETV